MPRIHSHVPGDTSPFGSAGQHVVYQRASALYRQDKLEPAYQAMLELGTGASGEAIPTFRMIEAEFLTRQRARTIELSPVLAIEYIDGLVNGHALTKSVIQARDEAGERLGIVWESAVHITILDEAANAPWAPGRHGYCSPKEGFAKICLPHYLTEDSSDMLAALRHELTHALVYQETELTCATWLHEAAAMQIGGEPIDQARIHFQARPNDWMEPEELSAAFGSPRISEAEQNRATVAYWQAAIIGAHLAATHGEKTIGKLLKGHRLGFIEQLRSAFLGAAVTNLAVEKVLKLSVRELFEAVRPPSFH